MMNNHIKTFRDFSTRTKFVDYLGLYKPNKDGKDLLQISSIKKSDYQYELEEILKNLDTVSRTWNNQSVNDIEKSVAKQGPRQLEVMEGQKNEKLQAGYTPDQPMFRIKLCEANSYFYQLAQEIGLEKSLARFHVQFPGEVTAWHTDIYSPAHEFLDQSAQDADDLSVGQDKNIRRVLIALENWQPGHMLMFGQTTWTNWKAGDVVYWEYGVPHGAANMGYTPRISVSITGRMTDKFTNSQKNARRL
jgi:hypothetical protein